MVNTLDREKEKKKIKCVVWDLDNTLWKGVLLEDGSVTLREGVLDIIKTLDSRGILQSIASKNEHNHAMAKLEELRINEYFIYPQINWNSKSSSIKKIAESINIGLDTIAFIDDQEFELDEVKYALPSVQCINAIAIHQLTDMNELIPKFITEDSNKRRSMYISDIERKKAEEEFSGPQEEFLSSLNMEFKISSVKEDDLQRAEELTVRTNQLNTTGYTYSFEELSLLQKSNEHILLMASLKDKYGSYGKIGLALIECSSQIWTIKLLLMSCRVMSRGVGTIFINHIMSLAKKNNVTLRAEFVDNDRNRMMYITYKFSGFYEIEKDGKVGLLENSLSNIQSFPEYVKVVIED